MNYINSLNEDILKYASENCPHYQTNVFASSNDKINTSEI